MVGGALKSASMDDFDLRMSDKVRPLYEAALDQTWNKKLDLLWKSLTTATTWFLLPMEKLGSEQP